MRKCPMRISVYKLQSTSGDSYLTIDNWKLQWEKAIPLVESFHTYGWMISMTAADVNKDGVDDIAFTYSNFQGKKGETSYDTENLKDYEKCDAAFVAFGADGNRMLSDIVDVPVDNLYRTGLAVGDVDSDGLVAQSSVRWEDESDGSQDWERYYEWNARAADFTGSGQELICLNYAYLTTGANALWYTGLKQKCVFASVSDSSVSKVWEDSPEDKNVNGWENSAAIPYCLPNTDNDTIVLRYTGKHYYTYADPEVLAVLASPPYFADLANDDDDSQMIESKTSYGSSHGSGGGSTYSNSFSIGVYTSWEHSFSMLGVELAHSEVEATINNAFHLGNPEYLHHRVSGGVRHHGRRGHGRSVRAAHRDLSLRSRFRRRRSTGVLRTRASALTKSNCSGSLMDMKCPPGRCWQMPSSRA